MAKYDGGSWNQSVILRETCLGSGVGRGIEVSLCSRGFSILSSHPFHKYCFSTHCVPGRESSSSLQPWTGNQFPVMGLAPGTRHCVPAKPRLEELWANVSIWAEKGGNTEGTFYVSGLKPMKDVIQARGNMKGCALVVASNLVEQGNTEMMTWEVREGFRGRSWGETNKNVPYFTTLSRILVMIRVLGKNAG